MPHWGITLNHRLRDNYPLRIPFKNAIYMAFFDSLWIYL